MDSQSEIPLRPTKNLVRRLRTAGDRQLRNTLLSSICLNDLNDIDMKSHRSDESDGDYEMHDISQQYADERLRTDSVVFQDPVDATPDDKSFSSDHVVDDAEDETLQQSSSDVVDHSSEPSLPSFKEISVALALFRHRHKLSKTCINDLCVLLRSLGVTNAPVDFRAIERNVLRNQENVLKVNKHFICSACDNKGTDPSKCESNNCRSHAKFKETPTTLCTFKLLPQITSILERHELLEDGDDDNPWTTDVRDAQVRRNVVLKERTLNPQRKIVTLLLNSDGVVLKKFDRSLWITCMVINELPRDVRYNTNNIIICSISAGPNKPKKKQFQSFMSDWIYELRQLELGFYISLPGSSDGFTKVYAYLIAASMDKPAQALVCHINEPNGFHSCIHCTIRGTSVLKGKGSVRAFRRDSEDNIVHRTNALYDKHVRIISKRKGTLKSHQTDLACGQKGTCLLRDLMYFEVGRSFTADSLHNIYSGTFKRLLELWFSSRGETYSIHNHLKLIEAKLDSICYPSTTYHLPSQLRYFHTYKGNEYRLILLFGYQYFKTILPPRYYKHLKLLAYAMSLAESSVLHDDTVETIEFLLDEFDRLFPLLYPIKSMTSVIHSVVHVPQTLKDFGPIQNYSTFNFESAIGTIIQSVNGPNLIISELVNNINLAQGATIEFNQMSCTTSIKPFVHRLFSSKRYAFPDQQMINENGNIRLGRQMKLANDHPVAIHLQNTHAFSFDVYKTFWKNNIRFSIFDVNSTIKTCDGCILFKYQQETCCGFIKSIVYDSEKKHYVVLQKVHIDRYDTFTFKQKHVINPFIFWGNLTVPHELMTVHLKDIIVKLAYSNQETFHFHQYPNTVEST